MTRNPHDLTYSKSPGLVLAQRGDRRILAQTVRYLRSREAQFTRDWLRLNRLTHP